jgi:V8-like Glu-specific endopeptidase
MRVILWSLVGSSALLLIPAPTARAQDFVVDRARENSSDMRVQAVDPHRALASLDAASPPFYRLVHVATVHGVRVHVVVDSGPPGTGTVRFTTLSGETVESVRLADVGPRGYWSRRIPGRGALVEAIGGGATPPTVRVDKYAYEEAKSEAQAIHGANDLWAIGDSRVLAAVKSRSGAVGRLRFMTAEGEALCSGFLLTRDLFMTNNHCVSTAEEAASAVIDFGYDSDLATATEHRVKALGATDAALDFSVLRLSVAAEAKFGPLSLGAAPATDYQNLWIIQHPAGEPKQVSQKDCAVDGVSRRGAGPTPTDFGHICDTKGGSSGSPVLDTSGNVVGLHHLGFYGDATTGVNQAVHIGLVLQRLQTLSPALYREVVGAVGGGQD